MIGNIFASPRTTLAGLAAVVVGAIGANVVPAIVAYFGAQPSSGWQLLGMALGAVVPGLMADAKKKLDEASQPKA
jgi:hypothetical protein